LWLCGLVAPVRLARSPVLLGVGAFSLCSLGYFALWVRALGAHEIIQIDGKNLTLGTSGAVLERRRSFSLMHVRSLRYSRTRDRVLGQPTSLAFEHEEETFHLGKDLSERDSHRLITMIQERRTDPPDAKTAPAFPVREL